MFWLGLILVEVLIKHLEHVSNVIFLVLADKQINGCSLDQQEDRGRLEVEVKPVEPAITEEHMSCVTGMVYVQET